MSFYFQNGFMYCENLRVKEIQEQVPESPFYLYSLRQIQKNYQHYVSALKGLQRYLIQHTNTKSMRGYGSDV